MSATGLIVRIKPQVGQAVVTNEIGGGAFTGTGTPTLVDIGAEKAWAIAGGTSLLLAATKSVSSTTDGGGITLAVRLRVRNYGTTNDAPLVGMTSDSTSTSTIGGAMVKKYVANNACRPVYGTNTLVPGLSVLALNAVQTVVYTAAMLNATSQDQGKLWYDRTDRVGTDPDAVSSLANASSLSLINAFINSSATMEYDILDVCVWDRELTPAEAATVADDIRGAIDGGGTDPTGTVTIGTITTNSTGATVPFTYSAADQTGFEYRLNGGTAVTGTTSPQVLTGLTPSTSYTIEIRAINATGAGAWSTAANFTTSATGSPPAGTFTIGTITTTQTTASVPYTYSAADFDTIEYRIDGGAPVTASASPQALTGLTSATTYGIEFRAVNAFGSGDWSTSAPFTTAAVPVGTITLTGLADNTATLWSDLSGISCTVMNEAATSIVVTKTGLTANAGGTVTFNDAVITAGTWYTVVIVSGNNRGIIRIQAT